MAGALLCGMAVFTSCEKEESASEVSVDLLKTATIKGYVYGNIDESNEKLEKLSGKTVNIKISNADLLGGNDMKAASVSFDGYYGYWTTTATTDANGVFEVTVPVTDAGVSVEVQPLTFEASVPQTGANVAPLKKIFTCESKSAYLRTGEVKVLELTFGSDELDVQ